MKSHSPPPLEKAVSDVVGVILIVFLVVALAGIIYSLIFGLVSSVEKTAYVVTDAQIINISPGIEGVEILHKNGDAMYYENQSQDAQYEVRFMVDTNEESSTVRTDSSLLSSDKTWSPGDRAIIFKRADGYYLSNELSLITGALPLPAGSVAVRVIDNTHHQLIAYRGAGSIGETSPTPIPTTPPTTIPTTVPTTVPTPTPTQTPGCVGCGPGEGFTVDFTATIPNNAPSHTLRFQDASSPQPNNRLWDFGDGGSANGQNIIHTFPAAGSYPITHTVSRNQNPQCICTITRWISVG